MGLHPCVDIHDQLHLLRGKRRVAQGGGVEALLGGFIDHVHLVRRIIAVIRPAFFQRGKDSLLYKLLLAFGRGPALFKSCNCSFRGQVPCSLHRFLFRIGCTAFLRSIRSCSWFIRFRGHYGDFFCCFCFFGCSLFIFGSRILPVLPLMLFLVIGPDIIDRFIAEQGIARLPRHSHVLKRDHPPRKVHRVDPVIPSVDPDLSADRQEVLPTQVFGLTVCPVGIFTGKADAVSCAPQDRNLGLPARSLKSCHIDFTTGDCFPEKVRLHEASYAPCILPIELKIPVLLKTDERVRVLLFQCVVFR